MALTFGDLLEEIYKNSAMRIDCELATQVSITFGILEGDDFLNGRLEKCLAETLI